MGPSLLISTACPQALAVALKDGVRVFEAIVAEKSLQSGSSCAIVAGSVLEACQNACCVVKSYHKHRLDEFELQQVRHTAVWATKRGSKMALRATCFLELLLGREHVANITSMHMPACIFLRKQLLFTSLPKQLTSCQRS